MNSFASTLSSPSLSSPSNKRVRPQIFDAMPEQHKPGLQDFAHSILITLDERNQKTLHKNTHKLRIKNPLPALSSLSLATMPSATRFWFLAALTALPLAAGALYWASPPTKAQADTALAQSSPTQHTNLKAPVSAPAPVNTAKTQDTQGAAIEFIAAAPHSVAVSKPSLSKPELPKPEPAMATPAPRVQTQTSSTAPAALPLGKQKIDRTSDPAAQTADIKALMALLPYLSQPFLSTLDAQKDCTQRTGQPDSACPSTASPSVESTTEPTSTPTMPPGAH
jgi:hypothetical protein